MAVNDTIVKSAPKGAIDQIGECLSQFIHAFAEASEDAKIFMANWDIKELSQGQRMELFTRATTTGRNSDNDCCTDITPNGLGQITPLFLRSN